jgi:Zn-dependent protease with chaperone function
MLLILYLPIAALMLFALVGPYVGGRLRPGRGAWLLTIATAVTSAGYLWSLVLIAGTLIDDVSPVWAGRPTLPVPDSIGLTATGLLVIGLFRAVQVTRQRWRLHRDLRRACAGTDDDLVVLADPQPLAFTVPGKPGRIVVSEGMLRALSAGHRRVLFAHEREHLTARHSGLLAVVRTAAAINPILVPVSRVVSYLCERSADEAAARVVGDRKLAAQALAVAALAAAPPLPAATTAFHRHEVRRRVAALQAPAPVSTHRLAIAFTFAFCTAIVATDLVATDELVTMVLRLFPF